MVALPAVVIATEQIRMSTIIARYLVIVIRGMLRLI
jgi:hypothetical protein